MTDREGTQLKILLVLLERLGDRVEIGEDEFEDAAGHVIVEQGADDQWIIHRLPDFVKLEPERQPTPLDFGWLEAPAFATNGSTTSTSSTFDEIYRQLKSYASATSSTHQLTTTSNGTG